MQERCDLWVNLDTPELGDATVRTGDPPAAYLRFESSGQTFGLPDLLPSSEGSVRAIPMLWSDALGRGIETRSFTGDVKLCYATDGPDGWRCSTVTIVGINPDGRERPIRGARAAYEWLRAWEHRAEHSASPAGTLDGRVRKTGRPSEK